MLMPKYHELRKYGTMLTSKSHLTANNDAIRFETYTYGDTQYIATLFNDAPILIDQKFPSELF